MKILRDRVAAITGAGSGIGRALAAALAEEGAELALSDIDEAGLAETARLCAKSPKVSTQRLDVTDKDAVFAWADAVVKDHGRANLIFNNAGVALAGSLKRTKLEDFHWLMNINFWGVIHGTYAFLPHLERSGAGHVVNISSVFGIIACPMNGVYNASKFAVRGFTEALRMELELEGLPIGVTSVHPGGINTNIAKSTRVSTESGLTAERVQREFKRFARTSPEECAATILAAVKKNKPRVLVGVDAHLIDRAQRSAPEAYMKGLIKVFASQWPR